MYSNLCRGGSRRAGVDIHRAVSVLQVVFIVVVPAMVRVFRCGHFGNRNVTTKRRPQSGPAFGLLGVVTRAECELDGLVWLPSLRSWLICKFSGTVHWSFSQS